MKKRIAALLVALAVCVSASADPPQKIGRALLTFYWIIDETSPRYAGQATVPLRDMHGDVIEKTTRRFRHDLVREGCAWLRDGRTVLYERKVRGEHRFRIASARYGLGTTGRALVPFRSIAVDPKVVKLGSVIYIPQLKGARLPDGTIHDGMFIAADRGHFHGPRVDVFVGAGSRGAEPFVRHGYGSRSHVTLYRVK